MAWRCVAPTVRQNVCFCEKSSTRSSKARARAERGTATQADLKWELKHTSRQFPLKVRGRLLQRLWSCAFLRFATAAAPTTRRRQCGWDRARTISLRGMSVVGITDDYTNVWACRKRRDGDAPHAQRGVDRVCSQVRWRAQLLGAVGLFMGPSAAACLVRVRNRLVATCFAMRLRLRRAHASRDVGLSTAGIAHGWQRPTFESPRSPVGSSWGVVHAVGGLCES